MLPAAWRDLFGVEKMFFAGGIGTDINPGNVLILANFFRRGQSIAVSPLASASAVFLLWRRQFVEPGILADTSDQVDASG